MKKTIFLLLVLLGFAFAQESKQKVAVYMAGSEPAKATGSHKILGTELAKAISGSDAYSGIDRTAEILKQISKEQKYQRSGAVSDEQIKELGKQFGVQYICVAEISEVRGGSYFLEARLVDVETAEQIKVASETSNLEDTKEKIHAAQVLARKLVASEEEEQLYRTIEELDKSTPDNDEAIAILDNAIRLKPKEAEFYAKRGRRYDMKNDYDKAIADYTEAIRLEPKEARYYGDRGGIYNHGKKDYDKAIADYTEAIRLEPNNASHYFSRGLKYSYNKEDYDKAIADFNKAIRLKPNDAIHYSVRGKAYSGKKDYNKAIADFNEAIRLEPNNAGYYHERGEVYYEKKEYDKAIADLELALRINPNYMFGYVVKPLIEKIKGEMK